MTNYIMREVLRQHDIFDNVELVAARNKDDSFFDSKIYL